MPSTATGQTGTTGTQLPSRTRATFESRLGFDFSEVRIHCDVDSQARAAQLHARAFTLGRDVYFGAGQFFPSTEAGRRLIAHELTHVVQQGAARMLDGMGSRVAPAMSSGALQVQRAPLPASAPSATPAATPPMAGYEVGENLTFLTGSGLSSVPAAVDRAIAQSKVLAPYVKGRSLASEQKAFTPMGYADFDRWCDANSACAPAPGTATTAFTSGDKSRFRLDADPEAGATIGTVLHEAIHLNSAGGTGISGLGADINEGVTEYFTRAVLAEQGLSPAARGATYSTELGIAEQLIAKYGESAVGRAYFGAPTEFVKAVRTDMERTLGMTTTDVMSALTSDSFGTWARFFAPPPGSTK